jgi:hypothetical protein
MGEKIREAGEESFWIGIRVGRWQRKKEMNDS